ncbi:MAG: PIG-L family deacetylase [Victivallales bacterium]|nr:PIG-L family deacetylase [Victivallales bacterium]
MMSVKRFLVIAAHPDDSELIFGGCALKLAKQGHKVKFVSCCNGDAGHFSMAPRELAARRKKEALTSAALGGLAEYEILENHDCKLVPSLENRERLTAVIRNFKPDVVISHRVYDYHADHRATAQLVQDSAYLVMVPLYCPEFPIPEKNPIYMFSYDKFKRPYPFAPDVAVAIDDIIPEKLRMLNCHESQFYEWLAYNRGRLDEVPETWEGRKKWLADGWLSRNLVQRELTEELLLNRYGNDASAIKYVESFELSEYGRQPETGEINELFPL